MSTVDQTRRQHSGNGAGPEKLSPADPPLSPREAAILIETAEQTEARAVTAEATVAELEAQVERLQADAKLADEAARAERRKKSDAKRFRNEQRKESPRAEAIERIFGRWYEARVARNPRSRGAKLTPDRFDAIDAALQAEYDEVTVGNAVVGIVLEPIDFKGKVFGDVAHALFKKGKLSGEKIERYAAIGAAGVGEEKPRVEPLKTILGTGYLELGAAPENEHGISHVCQACLPDPEDVDGEPAMAVLKPDGELHCSRGCSHEAQERALRDWWASSGFVPCPACGRYG